ncbi:MAG: cytochrome P450 [Acidimicrobiales bacterium]
MSEVTGGPAGSFGADWNPFAPDQLANPYPFYERARRQAPVFHSPLLNMWVFTRYDDVFAALQDTTRFSSFNTAPSEAAGMLGQMLYPGPNAVGVDPPHHTRLRAPLDPAFTPPRLAALEPEVRRIANELVDGMDTGGDEADLIAGLASPLPISIVAALFGAGPEHVADFQRWSQNLISFMTTLMGPEEQVAAAAGIAEYYQFLRDLIAEKRAHPGIDITSDLVHYEGDPPLSDGELVSTLTGLTFAGHPTVACLIGNAAMVFLDPRSRWEALGADPTLIPDALEEVFRLTAPVPSVIRRAAEDVVVAGVTIPAESRVLLVSHSANLDDAHFASPDEYQPGREHGAEHLTFVAGLHQCAGRVLARIEARIAYEVLLDRLPGLRLVEGQAVEYRQTLVIRGTNALQVAW